YRVRASGGSVRDRSPTIDGRVCDRHIRFAAFCAWRDVARTIEADALVQGARNRARRVSCVSKRPIEPCRWSSANELRRRLRAVAPSRAEGHAPTERREQNSEPSKLPCATGRRRMWRRACARPAGPSVQLQSGSLPAATFRIACLATPSASRGARQQEIRQWPTK